MVAPITSTAGIMYCYGARLVGGVGVAGEQALVYMPLPAFFASGILVRSTALANHYQSHVIDTQAVEY